MHVRKTERSEDWSTLVCCVWSGRIAAMVRTRSMCSLPLLELPPELLERVTAALCLQAYGRFARASRACKAAAERTPLGEVVTAEVVRRITRAAFTPWCFPPGRLSYNSLDMLCNKCPQLVLPAGITSLAINFRRCHSLTSITLPPNLESVGDTAFLGCSALRTVVLPPSIKSICGEAFADCNLTSITLPAGLLRIREWAFARNTQLTALVIPVSVTEIGTGAFACLQSIVSLTLPAGITEVAKYLASCCYCLAAITIPEGVTSIGDYAFQHCSALVTVTLPASLTFIGTRAFRVCPNLDAASRARIAAFNPRALL